MRVSRYPRAFLIMLFLVMTGWAVSGGSSPTVQPTVTETQASADATTSASARSSSSGIQESSEATSQDEEIPESVTEAEVAAPNLEWLVGTWVNESEGIQSIFDVRQLGEGGFLELRFQIWKDDILGLHGAEFIGWDDSQNAIHSWSFDSEGGRGEALWSKQDDRWTSRTHFVAADGSVGSAVHVFQKLDDNSFQWKSISREMDGELLPSIPMSVFQRVEITEDETPADSDQPTATEEPEADLPKAENNDKEVDGTLPSPIPAENESTNG